MRQRSLLPRRRFFGDALLRRLIRRRSATVLSSPAPFFFSAVPVDVRYIGRPANLADPLRDIRRHNQ